MNAAIDRRGVRRVRSRFLGALGAVAVIASLCACSTDRYYPVRYGPAPVESPVVSQGVPGSQVRALVTVIGIARADKEKKVPAHVELRIRVENLGSVEAKLLSQGLSLVSAD